ncbi:MAG TPA: bifunctional riboflavin kinase/FAD synthetase [Methylomirabilota bacterium]|jgi:riboflavin kinase/FMN adenylyltransferase
MQIVQGLESFRPDAGGGVVALGVFDGVHLGHRAILAAAVSAARRLHVPPLACTFDRHPMEVLQPERAPLPITTLEERLDLIAATGVDTVLVLAFTRELAAVEPEAFVKDVLAGRLRAREVVVGFNHRFGRGARGDTALLERLGREFGFRTEVVPPLSLGGVPVSSTEIRAALLGGDVEQAAAFLGRPYRIHGAVVRGAGRGHTLGFPTANLLPDRPLLVPTGVYACRAWLDPRSLPAVVNVGRRPTFGETTLSVEAHILDFDEDLYGGAIGLDFVARLRDEQKFPSIEALKSRIALDVAEARQRL